MIGLSVVAAIASVIVARVAVGQAKKPFSEGGDDEQRERGVARVLLTTSVLRAALCEGVGLLGALLIFAQGNMLGWIGVGAAIVGDRAHASGASRFEGLMREVSGRPFGM